MPTKEQKSLGPEGPSYSCKTVQSGDGIAARPSGSLRMAHTSNFAVSPEPPVDELTLMRRNFA